MPNWRDQRDYDFVEKCRSELIAWEFLRRNSEYQQDYSWFITLWNELEKKYGSPPNRDFNAWKKDPRAYRFEKDIYNIKENNSIDDNLLIECWMGTKWGFYKFPLDPAIDNPIIGKDLSWRTEPERVKLYNDDLISEITKINLKNKAAIVFDLQKDLKHQIQSAKQQLIIAQKNNYNPEKNRQNWILYLRIIDATQKNESDDDIKTQLNITQDNLIKIKEKTNSFMSDRYREIISTIN